MLLLFLGGFIWLVACWLFAVCVVAVLLRGSYVVVCVLVVCCVFIFCCFGFVVLLCNCLCCLRVVWSLSVCCLLIVVVFVVCFVVLVFSVAPLRNCVLCVWIACVVFAGCCVFVCLLSFWCSFV